jgi:hypothetical protein
MGFQAWLSLVWEGFKYAMAFFAICYMVCSVGMVIYGISQFFDWLERRRDEKDAEIWEALYRAQELNARRLYMAKLQRQQDIMNEWNY